ncbi:toprim domain-containing protein [Thermococcus sp. SY098]|uniref:toprim domain-containing protein n=1 Tax=Thermococcus sp. SY098 TaxID=3111325 RepID=UPI002D77AA27|nr:toprim domain-containing protein [Thermococcus sp. SY098]WRS53273.1 toprim domain-containing protein [Thermococcus sp. SY098]
MTIVDVRILVEGASDVEVVSKALQGLALGSEYNITISSIIPTTNLEIAKSAAAGADLLIIATDADRVGRELADRLFRELSELVGHVERMKIPLGHDLEHIDVELVRKELKNTLVRAGLKSLQLLPEYMALRNQLLDLKGKYDMLEQEKHSLESQLQEIEQKYEQLRQEYQRLKEENENLKILLDKRSNLVKIEEAWKQIFPGEEVPNEEIIGKAVERLGLQGRVIVGQGYIYAEEERLIEELLKIVYLTMTIAKPEGREPPEERVDESERIEETKETEVFHEKIEEL